MNNMTSPSLLSDDAAALVRRVGIILLGLAGGVAAVPLAFGFWHSLVYLS